MHKIEKYIVITMTVIELHDGDETWYAGKRLETLQMYISFQLISISIIN